LGSLLLCCISVTVIVAMVDRGLGLCWGCGLLGMATFNG
jgi:hypothetical protein